MSAILSIDWACDSTETLCAGLKDIEMTSSWMAERDRLLAQANSLVKVANTARPAPSQVTDKPHDRPLTPQPRPATSAPTTFAPKAQVPLPNAPLTQVSSSHVPSTYVPSTPQAPSFRTRSINEGEADHQPLTSRRHLRSEAQPGDTIPIPMLAGSERDDIEIRVTRFRERQTKLAMERQAHYELTQNEIASKLLRQDSDR